MTHVLKLRTTAMSAMTALLLAGCGGAGEGDPIDPPQLPDRATSPTISSGTVTAASRFITRINSRRDTPVTSFLPTGTATYDGEMLTSLSISGEPSVNRMIGDVRLTAELLAAGDSVTGTVSNIHTLSGNDPVERLDGSLAIVGTLNDTTKRMASTVSGELSGVFGDGERGNLRVNGTMNGRTQDTTITTVTPIPLLPDLVTTSYDEATGIAGTVSGRISGSETGSFSGSWAVDD